MISKIKNEKLVANEVERNKSWWILLWVTIFIKVFLKTKYDVNLNEYLETVLFLIRTNDILTVGLGTFLF
jgi:hypothetical protein